MVGVGAGVRVAASVTNGAAVCVTVGKSGVGVGKVPASEVGVAYCPHNDVVSPHADAVNKKEIVIKTLISRFTKRVRWKNYTCRKIWSLPDCWRSLQEHAL